ncbi:MAG TPA: ribbon-helix-helix protein, CopG family [Gammaproteobacteria bacterium]
MTKPIQVYLERADLESLEAFAKARGWTKSQAIRTAIRALTRRPPADPVLELSGDIDALPPDLSAEFDRYLNETFVAEPAATYRARRRNATRRPTVRR